MTGSEPGGPARGAEEDERVVSALADADERAVESALRPKRLSEFIGQARVREQLSLVLESALRRGRPPTTCCCAGRPASARPLSP